jgi:4-amino-4-deoxy-L-arabinose transferase-like glycosyltransferase
MTFQEFLAHPVAAKARAVAAKIVAFWNALATCWNPIAVIVVAWAVLTVPLIFLRGFHSDEGVAVSIAKSAVENGDWITPYIFGARFAERPTLLSWIIAAAAGADRRHLSMACEL